MLVSPRIGAVCDVGFVVGVFGQGGEYLLQDAARVPAREPIVNRLPRAEAGGQITPWRASLRDEQDRVEEGPHRHRGPASGALRRRKQRLQSSPLVLCQFVTVHHEVGSKSAFRRNHDLDGRRSPRFAATECPRSLHPDLVFRLACFEDTP